MLLAVGVHWHNHVSVVSRTNRTDNAWLDSSTNVDGDLWRADDGENVGEVLHIEDNLLLDSFHGGVDGADVVPQVFGVRFNGEPTRFQAITSPWSDLHAGDI